MRCLLVRVLDNNGDENIRPEREHEFLPHLEPARRADRDGALPVPQLRRRQQQNLRGESFTSSSFPYIYPLQCISA